jgi:hypothetical protein
MFDIILKCKKLNNIKEVKNLMDTIHKGVSDDFSIGLTKPKNMSPIKSLIWEYRKIIFNLRINKTDSFGIKTTLVPLPKVQKEIFERILKGEGKYDDYELIQKNS